MNKKIAVVTVGGIAQDVPVAQGTVLSDQSEVYSALLVWGQLARNLDKVITKKEQF